MLDFSCVWNTLEEEQHFTDEERLAKFSPDKSSARYWKRNLYCAWQAYHNPQSGRSPRLFHLCSTLIPTVVVFKGRGRGESIYHNQYHYNLRGRFLC